MYTEMQQRYPGWITFIEGLPTESHIEEAKKTPEIDKLYIIDDFTTELTPLILTLFQIYSHHFKISVVLLLHQLFSKDPLLRALSLSATHFCLKRNVRDQTSMNVFAAQFAGAKKKSFLAVYEKVCSEPFATLYVNMTPTCPDQLRVYSHLFKNERPARVYVLK